MVTKFEVTEKLIEELSGPKGFYIEDAIPITTFEFILGKTVLLRTFLAPVYIIQRNC